MALRNQSQLGRETYIIVRYEDLLDDLPSAMASLQTFLGITDHETLLQPTSSGVLCVANSSYSLPFVAGQVQKHSEMRYQKILTPTEHQLIEGFAGRHAKKMGYSIKSRSLITTIVSASRYALVRHLNP